MSEIDKTRTVRFLRWGFAFVFVMVLTEQLYFADTVENKTAETFVYLGKPRTRKWFDAAYMEFGGRLTLVDGVYYDVGATLSLQEESVGVPVLFDGCYSSSVFLFNGKRHVVGGAELYLVPSVQSNPPEAGELRRMCGITTVVQAVGDDTAIVEQVVTLGCVAGGEYRVTSRSRTSYLLKSIPPAENVMGASLDFFVVYTGPAKCVLAESSAPQTFQGYRVFKPITQEDFRAALDGGFRLNRYKVVKKKVSQGEKERRVTVPVR